MSDLNRKKDLNLDRIETDIGHSFHTLDPRFDVDEDTLVASFFISHERMGNMTIYITVHKRGSARYDFEFGEIDVTSEVYVLLNEYNSRTSFLTAFIDRENSLCFRYRMETLRENSIVDTFNFILEEFDEKESVRKIMQSLLELIHRDDD